MYFLPQFRLGALNVPGGIDATQTTGIILLSIPADVDITLPGILCLTYASPLDTSVCEWITYTSISGANELQGVTRGQEGYSAKTHAASAVVGWTVSKSHINMINNFLIAVTTGPQFLRPKITTSIDDSSGNEVIKTPATASAANELTITNSATGNPVKIESTGGDTNVGLSLSSKGTGAIAIYTGAFGRQVLSIVDVASSVNYLLLTPSIAGAGIQISPAGSDTNIDLKLQGKGTGSARHSGAYDGWIDANETWAYASANTITVPSGAASRYQKGDRIKWTQTTVKYGVIVTVADTLLTILVNTDYVVTNAAITLNYYSHQVNPIGYPSWFNVAAPTFDVTTLDNGAGGQPTTAKYRLSITGKNVSGAIWGNGTKATTNSYIRFAVPLAYANTNNYIAFGSGWINNGAGGIKNAVAGMVDNTAYIWVISQADMTDNSDIAGFGATFSYEF